MVYPWKVLTCPSLDRGGDIMRSRSTKEPFVTWNTSSRSRKQNKGQVRELTTPNRRSR